MNPTVNADGFAVLTARSAPSDLIERLTASGIPEAAVVRSVATAGLTSRLRALLLPRSPLGRAELARLSAIAALATDVREMEGSAEAAQRFWTGAMPWLNGKTPAEALADRKGPASSRISSTGSGTASHRERDCDCLSVGIPDGKPVPTFPGIA